MPRPKKAASPQGPATEGNGAPPGAPVSKIQAVDRALVALGRKAKPPAILVYVRDNFGITDMKPNHVSSYKSGILKRWKQSKKKARAEAAPRGASDRAVTLEEIRAVKQLADRIGVAKFRGLVELLFEQAGKGATAKA